MSSIKHFEHLPHPRSHINRRHDLLDIMFLSVTVTLSGAQGLQRHQDVWRCETGKVSSETQHYISCLAVDVKAGAKHIRQHWGVDNKVHWLVEMTFREHENANSPR